MTLTAEELDYLKGHRVGRLATVAPNGAPQNKPVGFRYNEELGSIDIYGLAMESSAKFRNIQVHPDVSFLVDDMISPGPEGARLLEIRGRAEAVDLPAVPAGGPSGPEQGLSAQIIRILPRRVVGWNAGSATPGLHTRDVQGG
jgi:pyridoxamine 5'-phosphate oxidase family protein